MQRQAVVSGMGCISAVGGNAQEFWQNLVLGKRGIEKIKHFGVSRLRNTHAGEVQLDDAARTRMLQCGPHARWSFFAQQAIREALSTPGVRELFERGWSGKRVGLVLGVSLGMSLTSDANFESEDDQTSAHVDATTDFSTLVGPLAELSRINGAALVVTTACASGTHAIGMAKDMIVHEGYDVVICGGVDTLDRAKYLGHSALNTLTQSDVAPFSLKRSGTLFGEGAGIMVLAARDRDSRPEPAVECSGAGYSCDAKYVTAPDETGEAAAEAMRAAIAEAGLASTDIDYINLHGSGTQANDAMEFKAIQLVFESHTNALWASSTKAAMGHTMGAAGALEAIATVMSIQHGVIPPTANTEIHEVAYPINLVCRVACAHPVRHALSNSFGFGGSNGVLAFSRSES